MVRALRLLRAIEDGEAIRERRDRKSGCRALWPSHSPLRNGPHGDTPQPSPSFTKCVPEPVFVCHLPWRGKQKRTHSEQEMDRDVIAVVDLAVLAKHNLEKNRHACRERG